MLHCPSTSIFFYFDIEKLVDDIWTTRFLIECLDYCLASESFLHFYCMCRNTCTCEAICPRQCMQLLCLKFDHGKEIPS